MIKIAVYGKGGIGKSTIVSNLSVALAEKGLKVMQIGCDPKADSTIALRRGALLSTVLKTVREKKDDFDLEEITCLGYAGVVCVEAGGPIPGLGCAGRGIITALEKLESKGAYDIYRPDVVFYDVRQAYNIRLIISTLCLISFFLSVIFSQLFFKEKKYGRFCCRYGKQ